MTVGHTLSPAVISTLVEITDSTYSGYQIQKTNLLRQVFLRPNPGGVMHLFLIIIMFDTGTVTSLPFENSASCIESVQTISKNIPAKSGYVTCLVDKGK